MRRTLPALGLAGAMLAALVAVPAAAAQNDTASDRGRPKADPIVIAHRGASGYRPEHTLEAYRLAIRLGADYIEPDLVSTKDGVLVARHENEISGTTDVASHPEFTARKTTKTIDGTAVTGWFTEDFTLAELKTLRAKERLPQVRPTNTAFDGTLEIPTLQEVIDLARTESKRVGRTIGIYPETKHPTYFQSIGLPLEEPLVAALDKNRLNTKNAQVIIQSFETANLRKLDKMTKVKLAQLMDASGKPYDFVVSGDPRTYQDLTTPANLAWIGSYADGIGATKNLIVPRDASGGLLPATNLVRDAHRVGLIVHAWTFRAENQFLPTDFRIGDDPNARGDITSEYELFYGLGLDGVFSDHPDTAVAAREGR
ncbi:glycerophosphodiester phosphodiesterase [Yinghuangia sp. ASG 101]|uniref:glycerophosphodiester phosphodiesterase n=1 Tax=Yinghuangia sp. ASG 101 TaxID=2896848 RepID=UPI001E3DD223|nr:glycerophosphodiester phosphodiesterase [Yinghuangia sp. ASG 101]UGQ10411.1 glycerophosphodiester phosphodiesterase [Yinghuangia sp. ASG 101]